MRPKQFTLKQVQPTADAGLVLHYADGATFKVNLVPIIERRRSLAPLKEEKVFAQARVGEFGASVVWGDDDELELAADNLRARAIEQTGEVSHEFIVSWMEQSDLTVVQAAKALGLSPRMLGYYRSGERPIPRSVALACIGWSGLKQGGDAARMGLLPAPFALLA